MHTHIGAERLVLLAASFIVGLLTACDRSAESAHGVDTVSAIPACPTCEVVLDKVFTIVDSGGPTSITLHVPPVTDSRGRFFFSSNMGGNGIIVFDSTGRFLTQLGRLGSGPGEFGPNFSTIVGKGDTIFVCGAVKCQLFSPSFEYVRYIEMSRYARLGAVVFSNGDIAFKASSSDSAHRGYPIHRLSTSDAVVRSLGAVTPFPRTCAYCIPNSGIGIARDSTDVWLAPAGRYELQLWSGDGDLKRTIVVRDSPWFTSWDPSGGPNDVMSVVSAADHDPSGILFIHGSAVVRSDTAIAPSNTIIRDPRVVYPPNFATRTPQIDAIDPATGRVLASLSMPGLIVSRFGGKFPVTIRELSGTTLALDVWRVRLKR